MLPPRAMKVHNLDLLRAIFRYNPALNFKIPVWNRGSAPVTECFSSHKETPAWSF
jgi:hypothetical protein